MSFAASAEIAVSEPYSTKAFVVSAPGFSGSGYASWVQLVPFQCSRPYPTAQALPVPISATPNWPEKLVWSVLVDIWVQDLPSQWYASGCWYCCCVYDIPTVQASVVVAALTALRLILLILLPL